MRRWVAVAGAGNGLPWGRMHLRRRSRKSYTVERVVCLVEKESSPGNIQIWPPSQTSLTRSSRPDSHTSKKSYAQCNKFQTSLSNKRYFLIANDSKVRNMTTIVQLLIESSVLQPGCRGMSCNARDN